MTTEKTIFDELLELRERVNEMIKEYIIHLNEKAKAKMFKKGGI